MTLSCRRLVALAFARCAWTHVTGVMLCAVDGRLMIMLRMHSLRAFIFCFFVSLKFHMSAIVGMQIPSAPDDHHRCSTWV